jgi:glycosyltransferase involved in cell wall biosynthesis
MNILYLCDEYPPGKHGGIGTAVQVLAKEMVRKGNNVIIAGFYDWGYNEKDFFEDEGVKVYRFRRILASKIFHHQSSLPVRIAYRLLKDSGIFEWDIKRSLKRYKLFLESLIKDHKIDIVEMPDYNDYMRFCKHYVAFPKLSVPTIVKMHGCITYIAKENNLHVSKVINQMEKDILMQADAVCSVSNYNATKTAKYLSFNSPVYVLHNGIPIAPSSSDNSNKVTGRVVFTGALSHNKGIYQLLRAWNIVVKRWPSAQLYVFGKGPVEKVRRVLTTGSANSVFFKGHVSRTELFSELSHAVISVFPSYAESFALAPMEAMLCNTAVIYTSRTSGPELIDDGITGYLVDPDDVDSIAEKIIFLLNNPKVCKTIAKNGKDLIKNKFDIRVIADKNVDFYKSVIKAAKN